MSAITTYSSRVEQAEKDRDEAMARASAEFQKATDAYREAITLTLIAFHAAAGAAGAEFHGAVHGPALIEATEPPKRLPKVLLDAIAPPDAA
jgi:hypothetical protein